MSDTNPVRYEQHLPDVQAALMAVHKAVDSHGLDRKVHHLVITRASQINGCAHCINMHLREARADGETQDRLDRLIVWNQVDDFTPAEKAALAWTETLTTLDPRTDYGPLRARLRQYFSDEQISALTVTVGMINFWNRFAISRFH